MKNWFTSQRIFNLANTLNLLFGLLAAIALGLQFRRGARPEEISL
ncbi:MAG: hypothetical protein ACE5GO_11795 [Anaerolineales bacterium]